MTAASDVLFAVATELAKEAKDAMPELKAGESICREWFENGIFYRETDHKGRKFLNQFDFRQRKSRRAAVGGD